MSNKWEFLTGDCNYTVYGGKWFKKVNDRCYHVIDLINIHEATGEEDQPKYVVELQEIDLNNISDKNINSALECSGIPLEDVNELIIIESISSYGCYIPMGNWQGNNYKHLLARAKDESRCLQGDNYHEQQLNRPVNKMGSTAREYGQGDFISAMIRGVANDDPSAKIIGKMYGLKEEDINEIKQYPGNKQFGLWDN